MPAARIVNVFQSSALTKFGAMHQHRNQMQGERQSIRERSTSLPDIFTMRTYAPLARLRFSLTTLPRSAPRCRLSRGGAAQSV